MTKTCATCKHEHKRMNEVPCKQCVTVSSGDCWEAKEDDKQV